MENMNTNMNMNNININGDYNEIRKTVVNYIIILFGIILIFIFILLGLYYLTPNNYSLVEWENDGDGSTTTTTKSGAESTTTTAKSRAGSKFKLENTVEYILEPNTNLLIDFDGSNGSNSDKYLKFSEQTNLIIKNSFKSQSVHIGDLKKLVKSKYNSEIFIINNSDSGKKIQVQFYSLI